MFIRQVARTNGTTSKRYSTLHLVESVRTPQGPRQRVVLDLGPLEIPREQYKELANAIEAKLLGQQSYLNDSSPALSPAVEDAVRKIVAKKLGAADAGTTSSVDAAPTEAGAAASTRYELTDLASLSCEDVRSIGAEWVGHQMYERLQLDDFFRAQGVPQQARHMIESLVVGRLVAPRSEHATWDWLQQSSALSELIGGTGRGSLSSLYRATDLIWDHHDALEKHLHRRERDLFHLPETIFLLDLTNTFLEGDAQGNAKAQRGHSKEKRSDCKLLSLALVVDEHGFAKCSRMYPGNVHESSTVQAILEDMGQCLHGNLQDMTVVMDRGLATQANLDVLREAGIHYIVAARGREAIDPALETVVINGDKGADRAVTVQRIPATQTDAEEDIYIRCHSPARQAKEDAIRDKQETQLLAELKKARCALSTARGTKRYHKVCERIGRLRERFPKAAPLYDITVIAEGDEEQPETNASAVRWHKNDRHQSHTNDAGSYLLRTNRTDLDDTTIWKLYITLTQVERSFRCLKSDLGLRPCYHHIERRSDAHLFIAVLAYHLLQAIEYTLRQHDDHRSWATIREVLRTHARMTVACATQDPEGNSRQTYIRLCSKPTAEMQRIYDALDMTGAPMPRLRTDF